MLFSNPELYAAEAYMDGTLTLENGAATHDFVLLFSVNRAGLHTNEKNATKIAEATGSLGF